MFSRIAVPAVISGLGLSFGTKNNISKCSDDHIPSLNYGWPHSGYFSSYDYKSVRRGFQVYRQVCASCHSLDKIAFRNLVGVTHNEAEMKKIAESYDVMDGPNDEGEMFERPGKLSDKIPSPYANEQAARASNAGALPPDLSLMVKARHGGENYIFSLLTGFVEPPAGKAIPAGLHYNPYFPGGAIAMAKPIMDEQLEFEDGTPCTESQIAKDVACFLAWTAEPEHDERKKAGVQWMLCIFAALALTGFYKRYRWSLYKSRKISYVNTPADAAKFVHKPHH